MSVFSTHRKTCVVSLHVVHLCKSLYNEKKERKKESKRRCKEIQAKLGQLTSSRSLSEVAFYIQFFPSCARLRQMIRGDEY